MLDVGIIVPGSCKEVNIHDKEDGGDEDEYVLYSVVVFSKGINGLRGVLRKYKYILREWEYNEEDIEQQCTIYEELVDERDRRWRKLIHQCQVAYSEVVCGWIHLKSVRIFVESVLRYGLPVDFQCFMIQPLPGKEKQLLKRLCELYSSLLGSSMGSFGDNSDIINDTTTTSNNEFYPFVFSSIDLK